MDDMVTKGNYLFVFLAVLFLVVALWGRKRFRTATFQSLQQGLVAPEGGVLVGGQAGVCRCLEPQFGTLGKQEFDHVLVSILDGNVERCLARGAFLWGHGETDNNC